ncbi:MAG TPA: RsmE family RNA methyltransferase [Chitinispirillaceae bacterium]|nr:RsmE family RNA methyltransferase [Chitinispirillaceae bacterium]
MRNYNHFLFYSTQATQKSIILDPAQTTHAVRVLRLKQGDHFNVTDGQGTLLTCSLDGVNDGQACGNIIHSEIRNRIASRIHLNIGIPDREALETAVADCAALGIERITPVICDFSQDQWWNKSWPKHHERLKNKMVAAMKQSLYPFLPELDNPVNLANALEKSFSKKITADPEGKSLNTFINADSFPISCFIGPPGGYSSNELSLLQTHGSIMVKIAPTRLRTELAAVVLSAQLLSFC